jgi:hypothetical protein
MAMIYWQDKLVGFIAEAIRAVCLLGVPVSLIGSLQIQDGMPLVSVCALLLLSQITVNGLRSQPPR